MDTRTIRIAILDLYNGAKNVGMAAIREIVGSFEVFEADVYDVRNKHELPGLEYDVYIFSGGPGNPLEWDEAWTPQFYAFIDILWQYNHDYRHAKPAFFICHSFQMMCYHFGLGELTKRKSRSFGVFPVHMTEAGKADPLFANLADPFFIADSRDYQFIQPNADRFEEMGASILAMEKKRPHVPLDRAVMAVRFSNAWVGTQFHPEADTEGMLHLLLESPKGADIRKWKGEEKFKRMIAHLRDPAKLSKTYNTILPTFLKECIARLHTLQPAT